MNYSLKKVMAGVLAVGCFGTMCGSMVAPQEAQAAAIKYRTYSTSPSQKNDLDYLKAHTIFSDEEITTMIAKGFSKEDIENIYVLHSFVNKEYDKLQKEYLDAKKNVDAIIEKENINKDDFKKTFDKSFPENDETAFGRVQRIKNLRHMKF